MTIYNAPHLNFSSKMVSSSNHAQFVYICIILKRLNFNLNSKIVINFPKVDNPYKKMEHYTCSRK